MKKSITKLIACCALVGGITVPSTAQLQSKVNFTLEQHAQIEALAKEYVNQGLDIKQARMKAEEKVVPEVVKLRIAEFPWTYPDHIAWLAAAPHAGSIHVDRDATIHGYTPEELVKKILLKTYTPADEARIQNVRFKGWQGVANGGNAWFDNNANTNTYGEGNRGLAYFTKGVSDFDIARGLLISTGHTWGHEGPNLSTVALNEGVGYDGITSNTATPFDIDIHDNVILTSATWGGLLEFDFCPAVDKATFDYIFGSEEYPEYSNTEYNDGFGFFVSGPYETAGEAATEGQNQVSGHVSTTTVAGMTLPARHSRGVSNYSGVDYATYYQYNIAQLPNGNPVSVNWTNWGRRSSHALGGGNSCISATGWTYFPWDTVGVSALITGPGQNIYTSGYSSSPKAMNPEYHRAVCDSSAMMELDGITIKLTAAADSLIPGKWYHMKMVICQKDINHGDGVFLGNLDLGQATSGIGNNHGWANWPAANDLLGVTHFYAGCADTLTIDFEPQVFPQYIEIIPRGALAGNIVGMDGNPLSLNDSLLSNQSRIVRIFQVSEDASFESGAEGWFETYSYEFSVHGTPNQIPSNAFAGDTSAVFNLYKRFTSDAVFNRPTTGYAGRLELNIKDGSPSLFRSVNGGITWENAYLPFRQSQLANLAEEDSVYIMLKEPNSCWNDTILLDSGTVPPIILRPVWMAEVPNAIVSCQWGTNHVISLQNFVFTITPTGANAGMAPVITTDRTSIPDSEGVTVEPNGDGSYTVTIYRVQEPIHVSIDFTTGNASIEDGNKIWSGNGRVYILSTTTGDATIYNVMGKLVNTVACLAGETVSAVLPSGFYIATLSNGHSYKVSVK